MSWRAPLQVIQDKSSQARRQNYWPSLSPTQHQHRGQKNIPQPEWRDHLRPDDQRASQPSSDIAEGDHQTSLGNYAEIGVPVGNALGQLTSFGFDGLPPIQQDWLVPALSREARAQPGSAQTMALCYAVMPILLSEPSASENVDSSLSQTSIEFWAVEPGKVPARESNSVPYRENPNTKPHASKLADLYYELTV
jgi:hypothetical protein